MIKWIKEHCCWCCGKEEIIFIEEDANEHTRLLQNTDSPNYYQTNINSEEYFGSYGGVIVNNNVRTNINSHSKYYRHKALEEFNENVIDVGVVDSQMLDNEEYEDRCKKYTEAVSNLSLPEDILKMSRPSFLLSDIPESEKMPSKTIISQEDYNMVINFSSQISTAISEIKVEIADDVTEDLTDIIEDLSHVTEDLGNDLDT